MNEDIPYVAVQDYAEASTTPFEAFMDALAGETRATQECPQMLTGTLAGRLLNTLVWISGARRVLEIGTYTGYSALAMAEALPEGGRVITCELDPQRAEFARAHIAASPYGERVEVRAGAALETIASLEGPFDLVFIDADKTGYRDYFHAVVDLLSERGVIVLDNMLRGGDVLRGPGPDDDDGTRLIRELNASLAADRRVASVLLPVRDGMTLVRRV